MSGCRIIVGGIMLAPLALLVALFAVSRRAGLVGLGFVLAVVGLYFGAGFLLERSRRCCPSCKVKKLKCINSFRANPPPNWSFFRCENCGSEFVEVHGEPGLVEREKSHFKDADGWVAT